MSSSVTLGFENSLDDIRLLEAVLFIYFFTIMCAGGVCRVAGMWGMCSRRTSLMQAQSCAALCRLERSTEGADELRRHYFLSFAARILLKQINY